MSLVRFRSASVSPASVVPCKFHCACFLHQSCRVRKTTRWLAVFAAFCPRQRGTICCFMSAELTQRNSQSCILLLLGDSNARSRLFRTTEAGTSALVSNFRFDLLFCTISSNTLACMAFIYWIKVRCRAEKALAVCSKVTAVRDMVYRQTGVAGGSGHERIQIDGC